MRRILKDEQENAGFGGLRHEVLLSSGGIGRQLRGTVQKVTTSSRMLKLTKATVWAFSRLEKRWSSSPCSAVYGE